MRAPVRRDRTIPQGQNTKPHRKEPHRKGSARKEPHRKGSARHLVVAADLALAGYSEEQIRERLKALGDPNAFQDAFE